MMNKLAKALFIILLSGLAYYFSSGFEHIWFLMWFAPIPVLIYAYSEKYLSVAIVAFIVGLAPGLNSIIGYLPTHIPILPFVNYAVTESLQWTLVILLSSVFVKNIQKPISLLAYPSLLSLMEWLQSLGPQGTFNTIAYSQLHFLPAMQIASITGFYGVGFILSLFASAIAYFYVFHKAQSKAKLALILSLIIVAISLGYGFARMHSYSANPITTVKVGLASLNRSPKVVYNPQMAASILKDLTPIVKSLSQQGAQVILLPEETLSVIPSDKVQIQSQLSRLVSANHITLIIGINDLQADHRYNSAWLFDPQGKLVGTYDKRHFVPVIEDGITPGTSLLAFPIANTNAGIAICRDMDYPNPAHEYGQLSTNILFVPAWDFTLDADVHDAGAFTRGIENGYTLVRAARAGYLSVTTPTGAIIVKTLAASGNDSTLISTVPIWTGSSFYAKHGDWFAWVLIAMLIVLLGLLIQALTVRNRHE